MFQCGVSRDYKTIVKATVAHTKDRNHTIKTKEAGTNEIIISEDCAEGSIDSEGPSNTENADNASGDEVAGT